MDIDDFEGNFSLDNDSIDKVLKDNKIGVYLLGSVDNYGDIFTPEYVGRSDNNIKDRLKQHASFKIQQEEDYYLIEDKEIEELDGSEYGNFDYDACTSFRFIILETIKEAFNVECEMYHELEGSILNTNHPARPKNKNWPCPDSLCNILD